MKHVIAILGIIFLMVLWFIPTIFLWYGKWEIGGAIFYMIISLLTFAWGAVMHAWCGDPCLFQSNDDDDDNDNDDDDENILP